MVCQNNIDMAFERLQFGSAVEMTVKYQNDRWKTVKDTLPERWHLPRLIWGMWNNLAMRETVSQNSPWFSCFHSKPILKFYENPFGRLYIILLTGKQTNKQQWKHNLRRSAWVMNLYIILYDYLFYHKLFVSIKCVARLCSAHNCP